MIAERPFDVRRRSRRARVREADGDVRRADCRSYGNAAREPRARSVSSVPSSHSAGGRFDLERERDRVLVDAPESSARNVPVTGCAWTRERRLPFVRPREARVESLEHRRSRRRRPTARTRYGSV